MKIGIDARCLEWNRGGVARYLVNVLTDWALDEDSVHRYVLYFQNKIPDDSNSNQCNCPANRFSTILESYKVPSS